MNIAQTIDTNGWDTVYAIYYPSVNDAIARQKSSPKEFKAEDSDDGYCLAGKFGDWQLTTGGAGEDVNLCVPITSSVLTGMGKEKQFTTIKLVIQVNLGWVAEPNCITHTLNQITKVSLLDGTDWGDNSTAKLPDGKPMLTPVIKGIYKEMMEQWFDTNAPAFQHTFAALDIDSDIAKSDPAWAWLKPTDKSYAVVEVEKRDGQGNVVGYDMEKSIFAVLCMTSNAKSPETQQVSSACIPDGVNSAFILNTNLLLNHLLLPYIPLMFAPGVAPDAFDVDPLNRSITNNRTLTFIEQELDDGKHVTPTVEKGNFTLTFFDTYIQLDFIDLYFLYSPGISVHLTHTAKANLTLNQQRQFKIDVNTTEGGFETHASVTMDSHLEAAQIAMSIGLSIAGSIVGGFVGGAIVKAVSVGAVAGMEATVNIVTTAAAESAAEATSNISAEVAAEAATETTATATGSAPGALAKFGTFLARNWPKILGSMIGGGVGATIAEIPNFVEMAANKDSNAGMPTLDRLGTEALAPMHWPNLGLEGLTIVSGELNGAFAIGINLTNS